LKLSSIGGTAKATQEADVVLILQKLFGQMYLDVKKNRLKGFLGRIPLKFEQHSLAFSQVGDVMPLPEDSGEAKTIRADDYNETTRSRYRDQPQSVDGPKGFSQKTYPKKSSGNAGKYLPRNYDATAVVLDNSNNYNSYLTKELQENMHLSNPSSGLPDTQTSPSSRKSPQKTSSTIVTIEDSPKTLVSEENPISSGYKLNNSDLFYEQNAAQAMNVFQINQNQDVSFGYPSAVTTGLSNGKYNADLASNKMLVQKEYQSSSSSPPTTAATTYKRSPKAKSFTSTSNSATEAPSDTISPPDLVVPAPTNSSKFPKTITKSTATQKRAKLNEMKELPVGTSSSISVSTSAEAVEKPLAPTGNHQEFPMTLTRKAYTRKVKTSVDGSDLVSSPESITPLVLGSKSTSTAAARRKAKLIP
jgi:hypothetical protein